MNDDGDDRHSIEEILAEARARLDRVDPANLAREHASGALIIDIRPVEQRSKLRCGEKGADAVLRISFSRRNSAFARSSSSTRALRTRDPGR